MSRDGSMYLTINFYPRPPRGGRLDLRRVALLDAVISIHVLREEDDIHLQRILNGQAGISIHVLREEDDGHRENGAGGHDISIHVLREEDDA